jgi:thiamine pyrophosphokinase
MARTALVFGGAPLLVTTRLVRRLAGLERPFVVAADAGAETALRLGFVPDVVVGDFDSLGEPALIELKTRQIAVERHPTDKDETDGQLAVERALAAGPDELLLIGFLGGPRLDQEVANILLLTSVPAVAVLVDGANECRLVRSGEKCAWIPERNEIVSLLPVGGDAHGVRTYGLRWQLNGDTLRLGSTRGVSNEPLAEHVGVELAAGSLLVTRHFADPNPQPPTPST